MMKKLLLLYLLITYSSVYAQRAFITTWEVELFDQNIMIPTNTSNYIYDYTVDFGDGTVLTNQTGNVTHVYGSPGIYTVSITGTFPHFKGVDLSDPFGENFMSYKLKTVKQWGDIEWLSMDSMFRGISFLSIEATDAPDLALVTSMRYMFRSASQFNSNINHWDVSTITNMQGTFGNTNSFNQPLNNWDVASVTDFSEMFNLAKAFNQNINNWDVSNATTMERMFSGTIVYNQPLGNWDVSNVTDFSSMFSNAFTFNQNINSWDVSNATSTRQMFAYAYKFNHALESWNVSNINDMRYMFKMSKDFNQALGNWDVSNVSSMISMFEGAEKFNQPINNWNVSNVENMKEMFKRARDFNQELHNWDVSNTENMESMFNFARYFNQPIGNWNVSSVTNMLRMFSSARDFNQELNNWDVSNVTSMGSMFENAKAFNKPLSNWDISSVTFIAGMFRFADDFNQDVSNWNFSLNNLHNLFDFSSMSKENYDLVINKLVTLNLNNGFMSSFQIKFCNEIKRQELLDLGWTINDGGQHEDCTLNVNEFSNEKISIFPNPVKNKIHLELPSSLQLKFIELYNNKGKLLSTYRIPNEIDATLIPQGFYFLKIYTNSGIYSYKIIKE